MRAIDGIDVEFGAGEFVVLLGPSGCGKTTLLRCLAGLESPDAGAISLRGSTVFDAEASVDLPPEKRRAGMMFQSYALWPHMTVQDNVAYPLKVRRAGSAEIRARVDEVLRLVGCAAIAEQYPGEISGGQQQRVALARAVVARDDLVLFDEPLSNVDAQLRETLRTELSILQRALGFTAVYVTHDQSEALALADTVIVLNQGRIAQIGPPADIYRHPASAYVARFMGPVNEIPGRLTRREGKDSVTTSLGTFDATRPLPSDLGSDVLLVLRPSELSVGTVGAAGRQVEATIRSLQFQGDYVEVLVTAGQQELLIRDRSDQILQVGQSVLVTLPGVARAVVPDDGLRPTRLPFTDEAA
ncbi:ABC transporter ATP-binding protein [Aeromicrobium phragmitis]|uniref:ABC transporter ATP-binding protein n=1 Tax=Aeromicrobium phragmitis TaxID=2478914 RepID=UPI0014087ED4|nr:ABC transporter ATP-binding protein [Aeromicrobium phragmitis]